MAKERVRSAPAETGTPPAKAAVDWRYTLFYTFFYFCLILLALFGIISDV